MTDGQLPTFRLDSVHGRYPGRARARGSCSGSWAGSILLVAPDVFHAPAVVDAVGHQRQVFDPGPPAGGAGRIEKHRAHARLREDTLDLPHQLLALFRVDLNRLLIHQLVELGIAISTVVSQGAAHVILVKHLIRIVDPALYRHSADGVVFARHL